MRKLTLTATFLWVDFLVDGMPSLLFAFQLLVENCEYSLVCFWAIPVLVLVGRRRSLVCGASCCPEVSSGLAEEPHVQVVFIFCFRCCLRGRGWLATWEQTCHRHPCGEAEASSIANLCLVHVGCQSLPCADCQTPSAAESLQWHSCSRLENTVSLLQHNSPGDAPGCLPCYGHSHRDCDCLQNAVPPPHQAAQLP